MTKGFWPSYNLIFFDCDSTLTRIEGIDKLAEFKGKSWRISVLTDQAMNGKLDLEEVYDKRLRAIKPTRQEVRRIARAYRDHMIEDAQLVIEALRFLDRQVFIISGGLADAVERFGASLGVLRGNIRAVELEYDQLAGEWWKYYERSSNPEARYLAHDSGPLTISRGKAEVVSNLADGHFGRRLLIGDGMSDLLAREAVDLFIGFGGVVSRPQVMAESLLFIKPPSLAAVLPLATGLSGYQRCQETPFADLFEQGLQQIKQEAVTFQVTEQREAFLALFNL